jgi:2Fe-2S ferredoxin
MPNVNFRMADGSGLQVDVPVGHSIMQGALAAGIDSIEAECGGALTCATCHVHIEDGWAEKVPPASYDEADLLEIVDDFGPTSRLSCQIMMQENLDGIVVAIP